MLFKSTVTALVGLTALVGTAAPSSAGQAPDVALGQPHAAAHAHNDYEHAHPLLDAQEYGFTSVEADVWLVDGELRVGHDLVDTRASVTLESLHLDPLDELVRQKGHSVFPG